MGLDIYTAVLHASIRRLSREPGYADFFRNLRYVVIDECHVYNGAFGSNMAYVLRRLGEICENTGANPSFILAGATTGNPSEHLEQLTGAVMGLVTALENAYPLVFPCAPEDFGYTPGSETAGKDTFSFLITQPGFRLKLACGGFF